MVALQLLDGLGERVAHLVKVEEDAYFSGVNRPRDGENRDPGQSGQMGTFWSCTEYNTSCLLSSPKWSKGAFGRAHHCTNVRGVKKGVPAGAGLKECGVHALITGTPLWARNMGKAP